MRIREMRNLGPSSERRLAEIDVTDSEELHQLGAAEAFRRLSFVRGAPANLNLLYAMEGALTDLDWRAIPAARKAALKAEIGDGTHLRKPPAAAKRAVKGRMERER